jgi:hypothetical protein
MYVKTLCAAAFSSLVSQAIALPLECDATVGGANTAVVAPQVIATSPAVAPPGAGRDDFRAAVLPRPVQRRDSHNAAAGPDAEGRRLEPLTNWNGIGNTHDPSLQDKEQLYWGDGCELQRGLRVIYAAVD